MRFSAFLKVSVGIQHVSSSNNLPVRYCKYCLKLPQSFKLRVVQLHIKVFFLKELVCLHKYLNQGLSKRDDLLKIPILFTFNPLNFDVLILLDCVNLNWFRVFKLYGHICTCIVVSFPISDHSCSNYNGTCNNQILVDPKPVLNELLYQNMLLIFLVKPSCVKIIPILSKLIFILVSL